MSDHLSPLARNLKTLCGQYRSIAQLCRKLGINRQQFDKYLAGVNVPSPGTLTRICDFFQIDPALITLPHSHFLKVYNRKVIFDMKRLTGHHTHGLSPEADAEIQEKLRPYCGFYDVYYRAISMPDKAQRGLSQIYQKDGRTHHRGMQKIFAAKDDTKLSHFHRREGMVSMHGDRIFIVDFWSRDFNVFTNTILPASKNRNTDPMVGLCLTVPDRVHRTVICMTMVYVPLAGDISVCKAIRQSGSLKLDDPTIPPGILPLMKNRLSSDTGVMVPDTSMT